VTPAIKSFVFGKRGMLLAIPGTWLVWHGKPSALSIAAGLPIAFAGEGLRMWAVGYSGVTTRGDAVIADVLATAGPYAHVRNPLYVGNFITATGFAIAFTGKNSWPARIVVGGGALAAMVGLYAVIVPHEEAYLNKKFGSAFRDYRACVPRIFPARTPRGTQLGEYDVEVIRKAESRTWLTLLGMCAVLAAKALRA
jgi:protein-S-isoprenylcysteine O-methyltransferase Ste14